MTHSLTARLREMMGLLSIGKVEVYDENEGGTTPPRPLWCIANEAYRRNEIMLDPEPLEFGFQADVHFGTKEHADLIAEAINALPALLEIVEAAEAMRKKLETIHEDSLYSAVWTSWQIHHGPYVGPQYAAEFDALRVALAAAGGLEKETRLG